VEDSVSHASLLVALTLAEVRQHGGIESALEWQMAPFNENGEWFRDGSRWDWYQVGGRFTGNLDGYDPYADPINQEECDLCAGTGVRPDGLDKFGADWVTACGGCNGCHGKGTRTAFRLKRHVGDILTVAELKRIGKFESSYAFLSNRHWHEAERMGFFGQSTYTECELKDLEKAKADPDKWFGRCLHKDEETGARVICWNEPHEVWKEQFVHRFVDPLPAEATLVNVDYHV
jgi:hypothetical protein